MVNKIKGLELSCCGRGFFILILGIFLIGSLNFASAVLTNTTMLNDTFEFGNFDLWTDNGATDWNLITTRYVSPTHSAEASANTNDLLSDNLNMSDASKIYISFSYWNNAIDNNDDVILYYWDGTAYDNIIELGIQTEGQWNNFSAVINDSQYFKSNFHIYIEGSSIDSGENLWVDNVLILKEANLDISPNITNVTASHSIIKGGNTLTIYANTTYNGVNDTEQGTLYFYCDDTTTPNSTNTDCTGGTTLDANYPYVFSCTFSTLQTNANYTEYCRVYDGNSYSSTVPNVNYTTDSTAPINSVVSVAGDTIASYFDKVNDGITNITISGEASMSCRWSSSDVSYSSMSNDCAISGTQANCSVNDVANQGFYTRHISCQDSLGNEQNSSDNLDVQFYLDYAAPTTSDNSNILIHAPVYNVTITETDNVDSDPTTYYCTATTEGCTPTILIDNGGVITYTSSNRGVNYLRYYSVDDAGNSQTIVNKTININKISLFIGASDNATTIGKAWLVNITTNVSDADSGQQLNLYVCNSSGATFSGCTGTEYCTTTGDSNLSCTFTAESVSGNYNWYAYVFDDSGESATTNYSGSYSVHASAPVITVITPQNKTYSQTGLTFSLYLDESGNWAGYSLDGATNVTMTNSSLTDWYYSLTLSDTTLHNITFYTNDSYGNNGQSNLIYFTVDSTLGDSTPPTITIQDPDNNTYYSNNSQLLNITSDENLSWAGYSVNGGSILDLGNTSTRSWNATYNFSEGTNNIIFYANDSLNNQGNNSIVIYVDLTNPSINSFDCTDKNDSEDVHCSLNVSDTLGLDYSIFSYNSTGTWKNSSQIDLSGTSVSYDYIIFANETSPSNFSVIVYVYDLSTRISNYQENVSIYDNTLPNIEGISYIPNNSLQLDPGVSVNVTANITDDYKMSTAFLMFKQISDYSWNFTQMNNYSTIYNATFVPTNGSWEFKINATDSYGNVNISDAINITVQNDTSQNISSNVLSVKSFTYSERIENNSLGNLIINNTGDNSLSVIVSLNSSSIQNRLGLNSSEIQIQTYSLNSTDEINLTIFVNTSGLTSGLYNYNLTISSEAGTSVYEKQLNIQTSNGPYLVVSIGTYSASVTKGQNGVELSASVTNLGTQDSLGTFLNWTLPAGFSISSGLSSRSIGSLPIGVSATNSLIISISNSATDSVVNLTATANSSNADSSSDTKQITIGSPQTITETVTTQGTSGGGGSAGGGGAQEIIYSKQIEVVRGEGETFEIEVNNKYSNNYLKDITIKLEGFLANYIEISPSKIDYIGPNSSGYFKVKLTAPPYKESYEEFDLKATIVGNLTDKNKTSLQSYKEVQNIKLVIQQISRNESESFLSGAEKAILEMKEKKFNTVNMEKLFSDAQTKFSQNRYYDSKLISEQIILEKNTAFQANDLISNTFIALLNPKKIYLITGNAVNQEFNQQDVQNSGSVEEVLNLAKVAFERGDYNLALERAQLAKYLLLLERKGNILVFVSIYWPFILFALAFITFGSYVGIVQHRKVSVTNKIKELNKKENIIKKNLSENQREYFNGKRSHNRYAEFISQNENLLSNLRKQRITLRNKRIKILKPEMISEELKFERRQIESEIKKLQEEFYNKKSISEGQYKIEFAILNERLGEIEKEKTTLELINKNAKK